jgi:hypothetical protein
MEEKKELEDGFVVEPGKGEVPSDRGIKEK